MGFFSDIVGGITGSTQARGAQQAASQQVEAGRQAIEATEAAARRGQEFLSPFSGIGRQGLAQADFLANPQAQFDFLQSNPLFRRSLDAANTETQNLAAARGRLSAGDTLEQLSNNVLLSAQPLIQDQRQDINNLLNFGSGLAQTQANVEIGQGTNAGNLLTDIGTARSAGTIGAANARAALPSNIVNLAGGVGSAVAAFSDPKLKTNIKKIGTRNGFEWFAWQWNSIAEKLGLTGSSEGVMADKVLKTNPELIGHSNGFMTVNYEGIL